MILQKDLFCQKMCFVQVKVTREVTWEFAFIILMNSITKNISFFDELRLIEG